MLLASPTWIPRQRSAARMTAAYHRSAQRRAVGDVEAHEVRAGHGANHVDAEAGRDQELRKACDQVVARCAAPATEAGGRHRWRLGGRAAGLSREGPGHPPVAAVL